MVTLAVNRNDDYDEEDETMDVGLKLQVQNRACSTRTVFTDSDWSGDRPTRKSVSSWWSCWMDSCSAPVPERSRSLLNHHVMFSLSRSPQPRVKRSTSRHCSGLLTTREHPFAFRQLWRHWSGKQKRFATAPSSGRAISRVASRDSQQ